MTTSANATVNVNIDTKSVHLLIGKGRTAQHLKKYFEQLSLNVVHWSRDLSEDELCRLASRANKVWLCISDSQIQVFLDNHQDLFKEKTVFHCSGGLNIKGAIGIHPMMTFPQNQLYELEFYKKIPFIVDQKISREDLDPQILNPLHFIHKNQKAIYHALLVVGGNFPQILAAQVEKEIGELGIQSSWFRSYFFQCAENYLKQGEDSLTGPLVRKDFNTIEANQNALFGKKISEVYTAVKGLFI